MACKNKQTTQYEANRQKSQVKVTSLETNSFIQRQQRSKIQEIVSKQSREVIGKNHCHKQLVLTGLIVDTWKVEQTHVVCRSQMSTGTGLMILDIGPCWSSPYQQVPCGDLDLLVHTILSCGVEVKSGRPLAPQDGEPQILQQILQIRWHHNLLVQHWKT